MRFVDHHLQPVIKEISSHIKDKVNNFSVPVSSILVTVNVRSLYTSIINNEGIAAAKKRYKNYMHKSLTTSLPAKVSQHF